MERIQVVFLEIEIKSMLQIKFALDSGFARCMKKDRSSALFKLIHLTFYDQKTFPYRDN